MHLKARSRSQFQALICQICNSESGALKSKNDTLVSAMLLTIPDATASSLFGMYEILASVGRDWPLVLNGDPGDQAIKPAIVASSRRAVRISRGRTLAHPDFTLAESPVPDLICIPDLFLLPGQRLGDRYPEECEWLLRCFEAGSVIASACAGTLLLLETGLLDDYTIAVHLAYADAIQSDFPQVRVRREQSLVVSGPEQRIVTAGGGVSWQDMLLYLVARFCGQEEALNLSRLYLLNWHDHGQMPVSSSARPRQVEDRKISESQVWLASHYAQSNIIQIMAERSGLKERSFKRRFRKATGMSPIDYVHALRVEEAKHMLEASDMHIEVIAMELGYEDASFFRRLFRRRVGMTPSEYRKRFSGIRKNLKQMASVS